jgi:hypothetical protein
MGALEIGLGLLLLLSLALAIGGVALEMPPMAFVFGLLAAAGGLSLAWLVCLPPIRKRWGERGVQRFRTLFYALVVALVVIPALYLLARAAWTIGPDPRFIAVVAFVGAVLAMAGWLIWRSTYYLRRSWQKVAAELGLEYGRAAPIVSGSYRGRAVWLQLLPRDGGQASRRWSPATRLSMRLTGSAPLAVRVRRTVWSDRLFPQKGFQPLGEPHLDAGLAFQGELETLGAALRGLPVLGDKLRALQSFPRWELGITPKALVFTCHSALVRPGALLRLFELLGDVADLLQEAGQA